MMHASTSAGPSVALELVPRTFGEHAGGPDSTGSQPMATAAAMRPTTSTESASA